MARQEKSSTVLDEKTAIKTSSLRTGCTNLIILELLFPFLLSYPPSNSSYLTTMIASVLFVLLFAAAAQGELWSKNLIFAFFFAFFLYEMLLNAFLELACESRPT